ncbi:hypothetical protein [Streptomyces sp. NPDC004528]
MAPDRPRAAYARSGAESWRARRARDDAAAERLTGVLYGAAKA